MPTLINKTNVKKFTLHAASQLRPAANFTRVSEEFLTRAELELCIFIRNELHRHPSKGVTIK